MTGESQRARIYRRDGEVDKLVDVESWRVSDGHLIVAFASGRELDYPPGDWAGWALDPGSEECS